MSNPSSKQQQQRLMSLLQELMTAVQSLTQSGDPDELDDTDSEYEDEFGGDDDDSDDESADMGDDDDDDDTGGYQNSPVDDTDPDTEKMNNPQGNMGGTSNSTLHDRISQLEQHTGLKKSAGASFSDRLDALELELLGEEYEGTTRERVSQLEKAAGQIEADPAPTKAKSAAPEPDEAPEAIDLPDLIKSVVSGVLGEAFTTFEKKIDRKISAIATADDDDDLEDPEALRKAAKRRNQYGQRKASGRKHVSDEDLSKSADDDDNIPLTFGDALAGLYALQGGVPLDASDFDDDDDD